MDGRKQAGGGRLGEGDRATRGLGLPAEPAARGYAGAWQRLQPNGSSP